MMNNQRPEKLICWKCGNVSVPAPEEATRDTRYICCGCSPLGIAEGAYFDRFQFDDAGVAPRAGKKELPGLLGAARESLGIDVAGLFSENAEERLSFLDKALRAPRPASLRIHDAVTEQEPWALAATRENLRLLPVNQRIALVAFYWSGLSYEEIARVMGTGEKNIARWLLEAKAALATLRNGYFPGNSSHTYMEGNGDEGQSEELHTGPSSGVPGRQALTEG